MTTLMDQAIDALRSVPADSQDTIARVVMQITSLDVQIYELSPTEKAEIAEADAEIERGDFASETDMQAIWAKYKS